MSDFATIEQQLHRVRGRRNLVELQRALYLVVALVAAGAALFIVLALATSARLFAVLTWSVVAAVLASAALVVVETRRRWLGRAQSAAWIDRRFTLGGRLTSVVEIHGRADTESAFFFPLLVEQNVRGLTAWTPERAVPRRVPRTALATALGAIGLLLLAIALAPGLRPRVPEIIYSDRPIDGVEMDASDGVPDRVVVAPAQGRERRSGAETLAAGGDTTTADDSALARMSHALQEQIRRELWGAAWERMRDAAARLAQAPASARGSSRHADAGARKGAPDGDDGDAGEPWEEARAAGDLGARRDAQAAATGRGFERRDDPEADSPSEHDTEDEGGAGDGADAQPARAGNDTDPAHLFGAPSEGSGSDTERFELGISAPVRTRGGTGKRSGGDAPPSEPDARPELASSQREDTAVRRMPVPAAYESIVREVFAHRPAREDARP